MLSQTDQIKMQIAELEEAITAELPTIPTVLRDIHTKLKSDPDTVTLLSEEQIGVIVKGLQLHTNTTIAAPAKKTAAKKALKNTKATDL